MNYFMFAVGIACALATIVILEYMEERRRKVYG